MTRGPRWIVLALALALAAPAAAESLEERVATCVSCHGAEGVPIEPRYPIIAGQHFYYLYVQLRDFKAGRRASEIMQPIAAELSKEEMQALARHFEAEAWPRLGFAADDQARGEGQRAAGAGQCPQCHLGGYEGDSRVPRLAGQQVGYLEKTMLDFKNRVRLNLPAKGSLLASYDDAEIHALAEYLAGF